MMPRSLAKRWFQIEQELFNAIHIIQSHYQIPIIYPVYPSAFGYLKAHKSKEGLTLSMTKAKDWFTIWMALFSYVIAQATTIRKELDSYPSLVRTDWYELLLQHECDPQWLEAIEASTICSFSPNTTRTGIFMHLSSQNQLQPPLQWFYNLHIPVWYPWNDTVSKDPNFKDFAPLPHQLQQMTDDFSPVTHRRVTNDITPTPSLPAPPASTMKRPWQIFFEIREVHNNERIKSETPIQKQQRLSRLQNPPKRSAKVFEWLPDDSGELRRMGVSSKLREDTLDTYAPDEIRYDPITNEYDCCEEFGSGLQKAPIDQWDGDSDFNEDSRSPDELSNFINDNEHIQPVTRSPSPVNCELAPSFDNGKQKYLDSFIAEVLHVLRIHFGYTPPLPTSVPASSPFPDEKSKEQFVRALGFFATSIPMEAFEKPEIKMAADFFLRLHSRKRINADEWDIDRDNRESLYYSTRLQKIRVLPNNLFMFDFGLESTVPWKLTVKSASHVLLLCRLDSGWKERQLAEFLPKNGISFHTLQNSSSLRRSPIPTHPPLVIPRRPSKHVFTIQDYQAFKEQSHVILKQSRGRAALLRGNFIWRLAIPEVSFDSVLIGPSGWSPNPEEMFTVHDPDTREEYIDDNLTSIELELLEGRYNCATGTSIHSIL